MLISERMHLSTVDDGDQHYTVPNIFPKKVILCKISLRGDSFCLNKRPLKTRSALF
jgi:hypothetical protein